MNSLNLAHALESAELIHDRTVIEAAIARMGAQVTALRYPGRPHTISPQELEHARRLVRDAFA